MGTGKRRRDKKEKKRKKTRRDCTILTNNKITDIWRETEPTNKAH